MMPQRNNRVMPPRAILALALFAVLFCLAACAAAPGATVTPATTEAPTMTAIPTATPSPSPTPEPTPDPALAPVTLAWMSDTQGYASTFPDNLNVMTKWIVDNKDRLNIQYVLQSGDLVNDMLREREWLNVQNAFDVFVGKIPVFAIAGNHDIKGMMHMYDPFYALMSRQNYTHYPTFGGEEAQGRRRYDLITIGYDDYIIIGTGYSLQPIDYDWLDSVLKQYKDRTAILVAHWYMELKDYEPYIADAKLLHQAVAQNPNVRYVLCGHKHGIKHVEEQYDDDGDKVADRTVQAIMVDYQGLPNGGEGYLMLLTFNVVDRTVSITSYSPVLDDYNYNEDPSIESFTMPLSTVSEH